MMFKTTHKPFNVKIVIAAALVCIVSCYFLYLKGVKPQISPKEETFATASRLNTETSQSIDYTKSSRVLGNRHSRQLDDKLTALTEDFKKSERARSVLLYNKQGEKFSGIGFLIKKPDAKEKREMLLKFGELKEIAASEAANVGYQKKLEGLFDYITWGVDPETKNEYQVRLVQSMVTRGENMVENSHTIIVEAESYEIEDEAEQSGDQMPRIITHGDSKTSYLSEKETTNRYGQLFNFTVE